MKNTILLFAAFFFLNLLAKAQDNSSYEVNRTDFRKRLMFGIKAGTNYSNVFDTEGDPLHADPKLGFAGGVFLTIPIGRLFGIQPELIYSQKGFNGNGTIQGSAYTLERTSTYLDLPVLFAFKPSEFITLLAGPQYSYLMKQNDTFANTATSFEQEIAFQNQDLKKSTLGLIAGIDLTLKHIVLGARVGWDMQKNSTDDTSTPKYKNGWYQFTIGYRLYQN